MTYTVSDKVAIAKFLGYPLGSVDTISIYCDRSSAQGVEYEDETKKILRELAKIQDDINDARLGAGRSFQSGGASTAQYYRGDRLNELKMAGKQHACYLSQMLSLPIARDVFTTRMGGSSGALVRA